MAKPKSSRYQRRWTLRLFEWGVLACVVLILTGVFLRKVRHLQCEAERLTVQATIDNLRTAVLLASVFHKENERACLNARPGGNPAALLTAETGLTPEGYRGAADDVDPAAVAPGAWYFDRATKTLIYRVRCAEGFQSPLSGPARLRLCLRRAHPSTTNAMPLVVEPCESYAWGDSD
jgi:general secretion pathway protein G